MNQAALSSFIWSVADLLRGDYKPHEYGQVILPFTVLRRLDCVLAPPWISCARHPWLVFT
ncbi:type I restriction-modification system subunit M N-terminal domain-containing protein [Pseudoxanthomonas mexicana]|uniref:type I restriction-modification system subunit M N-terminal domain-containing protein n=1 Tax=Pseudoxanthomonas mexicana TaxID=128785 RepID=UPI0028A9725F|nr:type I restriction-modification system subunit M N-terminal domain-containing protein [Pseudoxanthomonas mexicana]